MRFPETDVTVENSEQARALAADALADAGHDATITEVQRQLVVWVLQAEAAGDHLLVCLDTETQRARIVD